MGADVGCDAKLMHTIRTALWKDNASAREIVRDSLCAFKLDAEFHPGGLDAAIGGLGQGCSSVELVAVEDECVVGCVAVQGSGAIAKLFGFHVAYASRGKGIGRALLLEAIKRSRMLGFTSLTLDTLTEMEAAVHLYESLGWIRDTETTPTDGSG